MKRSTAALALLIWAAAITGCSKKSDNTTNTNTNATQSAAIQGNWTISGYRQRTEDKTGSFSGYVFNFGSGGVLTATKSGTTTTGNWSYSPSSIGYYGGPPSAASVTISLGTATPLDRISRTWNVDAGGSTTVLSLVNPEPADDEHLTFSKQ